MEDEPLTSEIVPCSTAEVVALQQIACETYDQTFRSMNTEENMKKYLEKAFSRERLFEELMNPSSTFFFMRADEKLCGYMKLNEAPAQTDVNDPESLELERIYIRNELQGRGLGKVLINYAIEIARQKAKSYLWLGVWERNAGAIAFYTKMGFTVTGRHSFTMGDEVQQDLVMTRILADRARLP